MITFGRVIGMCVGVDIEVLSSIVDIDLVLTKDLNR